MAIISDHHWRDRAAGFKEMLRVSRDRVLILNADPGLAELFWMTRDYLLGLTGLIPKQYQQAGYWTQELDRLLAAGQRGGDDGGRRAAHAGATLVAIARPYQPPRWTRCCRC